jgi:hypothetical protein
MHVCVAQKSPVLVVTESVDAAVEVAPVAHVGCSDRATCEKIPASVPKRLGDVVPSRAIDVPHVLTK